MGGQRTCTRLSLDEHFTAYTGTSHAAQHTEHISKPEDMQGASRVPAKTMYDSASHTSTEPKPVDSAIGSPEAPASTKSADSGSSTQAGARPSRDSTSTPFKPPTLLRNYRDEPKLWVDYDHQGGQAGKAIAEWKENFVPKIYEATKDMTIEERTGFFDHLIEHDEDRFLQPLGTYYTFYPEHIPDRQVSAKQLKKIEEGMKPLPPRLEAAQKRVFRRHFDGEWKWDPNRPIITRDPDLGPKNELTPDDDPAVCRHCIAQTRKGKALRLVKPVMTPVLVLRRCFSKSVRADGSVEAAREVPSDDDGKESDSEGGSSRDSKPRDVTETGVGRRRPMSVPRRRRGERGGLVSRDDIFFGVCIFGDTRVG